MVSEYKHQWYLKNRERILLKEKKRRIEKSSEIKEYDKRRNALRRKDSQYQARMKILTRNWFLKNKDKINEKRRSRYVRKGRILKTEEELRLKARLRNQKYYRTHKEKVRVKNAKNHKDRMKSDINYRLINRIRTRLWKALKGISRNKEIIKLLGCSIEELKEHLETQFVEGMDWGNYGKGGWVIDHIIPICSFDLSDENELGRANHYSNLQPMWEDDNRKKSSKIC